MAKVNKMTDEVIVAESNDIDFGDLELKIAKPSLNGDKTISINGNFEDLGSKIKGVVKRYKGVKLTEDNVDYVKTLKGQFASLRIGIERERSEYKKAYITPASKLIDSMCSELQKIVEEGESALGRQLDEYDQRRKDELTVILNEYVVEYSQKYNLRAEYASQIQLKKEYYNKTQREEDSIADIEKQAEELQKKQKEYDAGVELIKMECEESDMLPDSYIRELQYKSATEIIYEIKADKKTKAEMQKKAEEEGKVTIGADTDSEIARQIAKATRLDKDEKRTRVLKVTYLPSQAKLMGDFFKKNNIEFEFLKTDF